MTKHQSISEEPRWNPHIAVTSCGYYDISITDNSIICSPACSQWWSVQNWYGLLPNNSKSHRTSSSLMMILTESNSSKTHLNSLLSDACLGLWTRGNLNGKRDAGLCKLMLVHDVRNDCKYPTIFCMICMIVCGKWSGYCRDWPCGTSFHNRMYLYQNFTWCILFIVVSWQIT